MSSGAERDMPEQVSPRPRALALGPTPATTAPLSGPGEIQNNISPRAASKESSQHVVQSMFVFQFECVVRDGLSRTFESVCKLTCVCIVCL